MTIYNCSWRRSGESNQSKILLNILEILQYIQRLSTGSRNVILESVCFCVNLYIKALMDRTNEAQLGELQDHPVL